jgi:hypothetical protein
MTEIVHRLQVAPTFRRSAAVRARRPFDPLATTNRGDFERFASESLTIVVA